MKSQGFTLVELLVALAIFAIISALAIPQYTAFTERGYRAEATSDLLNCAQAMERFNATEFTYVGTNPGGDGTVLDATICEPLSAPSGRYEITAVTTANTFLLTATPDGAMDGDGIITLDQAGNRGWDENDDGDVDDANEDDWNEDL
ncbi:MAG: prepilin-type N-terminal cleavage/methylation domain-containing protein [Pseudomonadaceae bacterium]|nr:prepilin-type N-terminal cleavage/methylation domain-containing protein [Pseudomonadaceae bacterium]